MTPKGATPISEVRLGMMDAQEIARVQGWLEGQLHCRVTSMSEGYYLVRFPDGATEEPTETRAQYQRRWR